MVVELYRAFFGYANMKIIFIYNADTGYMNAAMDVLHKTLSPSTYACNLCKLTHGTFSEKKEWSEFVEQSPHTFAFLHKDEADKLGITERLHEKNSYPCVLSENDGILEVLITSVALNQLKTLHELMDLVQQRVN